MKNELILLSRVAYRDQEITGPRLRGLLALLAGDLRTGCGSGRLVEGLWPDERPEKPTKALQVLVSRARTQLGPELIASTPTGYRLTLSAHQVDAAAILLSESSAARSARAGDHVSALTRAEEGLALWEGDADGDALPDDPVSALRAERLSTRRSLSRVRALSLARLGRCAEAVEPLADLATALPQDEEVLAELLRCEAATAGPSAALSRYDAYRRRMRDELGADPGAALRETYQQLLRDAAPAVRRGIPHEPNPLLGRAEDVAAVTDLLRTSRVTSIVGPGGLGKTRLAHAVSRRAEHRVVHFVPLAGVAADGDVAAEVLSSLGSGEAWSGSNPRSKPTDAVAGVVHALGAGPALLVLDNCEHVLIPAAELVRALVSMAQHLQVLVTSRAPLNLSSETVYSLPELSLSTTVELFSQRARAVRPDVDLPVAEVTELCRRLDGLPLAAELAAARTRVMSVAEISRRLQDRFALLRGGARDAPRRHHTLHAVVDWSWNLIEPAGQAAMRALSIFPDGFAAEAARHFLGDDAVPVLELLVDQSLLKVVDTELGTRFRMLETIREFSATKREEAGETDKAVGALLTWARGFGAARCDKVFDADPFGALTQVRAEQDNLLLAMRCALARDDGAAVAAAVAALGGMWCVDGNLARMLTLVEETSEPLSRLRPEPDFVEVVRAALTLITTITTVLRGPGATRPMAALRRLPPALPDTLIRAVAFLMRDPARYLDDRAALLRLCRGGEPALVAVAEFFAGYLCEMDDDYDGALAHAERMLESFDERSSPWIRVMADARIAELHLLAERGEDAKRHLEAALATMEPLRGWSDEMGLRWGLVIANLQIGDLDEVERHLERRVPTQPDEAVNTFTPDLAIRAELLLARGDVEAGLSVWRHAAGQLASDGRAPSASDAFTEPWAAEARAAAVVAHARCGRLDLVADLIDDLVPKLSEMLPLPAADMPPSMTIFRVCGSLLLALAAVDLDRAERLGDADAAGFGARMTALAERFRFAADFQPTMSIAHAREAAERAD
ncbi:MAG: ATP-binding protein, partial [Stackebrandtia sp.]